MVSALDVEEITIAAIHAAYRAETLTVRGLVQTYLHRIERFDQKGPAINAVISLNPRALDEADRLDAAFRASGFVGPLHGIPIIIKDQGDVAEMPTTLGSILFEGFLPGGDSFVVAKLKAAGAVFLGKATLGEFGGGDTHGSLFGSTRNVYDLERTAGGSSGGSGASVSANFCTVAVGQEGFASIRRPASWNGVAGMRPTAGLVSRSGVFGGWPAVTGSLGPMARTVTDLAVLLDCMVGYDSADPVTAHGATVIPVNAAQRLDKGALNGARLGILREPMGSGSQPDSKDFATVTRAFDKAVAELRAAGAQIVDPITIPDLTSLLATRAGDADTGEAAFTEYFSGTATKPYASRGELLVSPKAAKLPERTRKRLQRDSSPERHYAFLKARDLLMTRFLQVMADNRLDAIVHKAVEHQPTLIKDGINPPYVDQKGAPHLNTFLVYVPAIVVPAGFTDENQPTGITFLGRPYQDAAMIRLAYAYEQATLHRRRPSGFS